MRARVVLVGIEYPENLGLVARAMKNFGLRELVLVKPGAKKDSFLSKQRAMHATDVLARAKIVNSLKEALRGTSIAIAATARVSKAKQKRLALSPEEAFERIPENARLAIVLGRESSGLTNQEAGECDFCVKIRASKNYESLNVAVAAGVLFYELSRSKLRKGRRKAASGISPETKRALEESFFSLVDSESGIQNPGFVKGAFKSIMGRAFLAEKEARALLAVLSRAARRARGGDKVFKPRTI